MHMAIASGIIESDISAEKQGPYAVRIGVWNGGIFRIAFHAGRKVRLGWIESGVQNYGKTKGKRVAIEFISIRI